MQRFFITIEVAGKGMRFRAYHGSDCTRTVVPIIAQFVILVNIDACVDVLGEGIPVGSVADDVGILRGKSLIRPSGSDGDILGRHGEAIAGDVGTVDLETYKLVVLLVAMGERHGSSLLIDIV